MPCRALTINSTCYEVENMFKLHLVNAQIYGKVKLTSLCTFLKLQRLFSKVSSASDSFCSLLRKTIAGIFHNFWIFVLHVAQWKFEGISGIFLYIIFVACAKI